MKANVLVRYVVPVVLAIALLMVIARCSGSGPETFEGSPTQGGQALSREAAEALGIEADTPADTLRTVVVGQRETNERLAGLEAANQALRLENQELRALRDTLEEQVAREVGQLGGELRQEWAAEREAQRDEVVTMTDRLENLYRRGAGALTGSDRPPFAGGAPDGAGGLVWSGGIEEASDEEGVPWQRRLTTAVMPLEQDETEVEPVRPIYTIAKNSTLLGVTAFTALIGRVPVGEEARVTDPYGFKLQIGRDNLIANGHEIPEVAYAVASGQAIGDWTLGCVSGAVSSLTFVFLDGRIVTIPTPGDASSGGTTRSGVRLGTLADDYGNPCVAGKRVTNAGSYLGQTMLALTLGAAAEGAASAETTAVVGPEGRGATTVVDGNVGRYAAGRGLSGAAREVARWVLERQAQEYDVIYVPPGAEVGIHVEEELRIDYDPEGRLVKHEGALGYSGGVRALD